MIDGKLPCLICQILPHPAEPILQLAEAAVQIEHLLRQLDIRLTGGHVPFQPFPLILENRTIERPVGICGERAAAGFEQAQRHI